MVKGSWEYVCKISGDIRVIESYFGFSVFQYFGISLLWYCSIVLFLSGFLDFGTCQDPADVQLNNKKWAVQDRTCGHRNQNPKAIRTSLSEEKELSILSFSKSFKAFP